MWCLAPVHCRSMFWKPMSMIGSRNRKKSARNRRPRRNEVGAMRITKAAKKSTVGRLLARNFFNRDPREVCPELLGKIVVRREAGKSVAGRIVEVEAYLGADDAAAHAAAGRTARNDVIFGPPGHAYVYFIYGMHYCLNISCMPEGEAGCVLIRALEPVSGVAEMARARDLEAVDLSSARALRNLTSGPARLCEAL